MKEKNKEIDWILFAKIFGGIGIGLLGLIVIWVIFDDTIFDWTIGKIDLEKANQVGGFIGGVVGVFWSAAAAILIYATFQEQKKITKKQQSESLDFLEKQQFESVFFQMLNSLMELIYNTNGYVAFPSSYSDLTERYKGQEFYSRVLEKLVCINKREIENNPQQDVTDIKYIQDCYSKIYDDNHQQLGHFYRMVYNIMKFVINSNIKNKKQYLNLIQAYLSNDILGLIFYNALSKISYKQDGKAQFFEWLEEYELLQNISEDSILTQEHLHFYPKTEFKMNKINN